jgi:hypothetical protein
MRMTSIRVAGVLAAAGTLTLAACDNRIAAPLETNVTPAGVGTNPLRALQLLASGIVAQDRDNHYAHIRDVAVYGREGYFFQLQDSRWVTGYLRDFSDNTSFGSGNWAGRFVQLRNIFNFRNAITAAPSLTPGQVQGANGFADTEEALQVHYLVVSRHDLGTPVSVTEAPDGLTPFVSRDSAYRFVTGKLNSGYASLTAAGAAFPFTLPSGYTGFTTTATYGQFNRALAARNEAYRGSLATGAERTARYQAALAALNQSFITSTLTAANLNTGANHTYSASSGDAVNAAWSNRNDLFAHMSITTDASVPQNDRRVTEKLLRDQPSRTQAGSDASTVRFNIYRTNDAPIPIIDNEELWLLRAEIQWFTGSQAAAVATLNEVARVAGGATGDRYAGIATEAQFLDALLAERRLSLLFEGHRWVDLRRFGRLSTLPTGGTGFTVATQQVVPQLECQARDRAGDPALKGPGCP